MMRLAATAATMFLALAACGECLAQETAKPVDPTFDPERKVKEWLKENVRDPGKLEFLAFSKPFNSKGCAMRTSDTDAWGTVGGNTVSIFAKYKTMSRDNQIETLTRIFFLGSSNGMYMFALPPEQFRTGLKADPFSKEFLK